MFAPGCLLQPGFTVIYLIYWQPLVPEWTHPGQYIKAG